MEAAPVMAGGGADAANSNGLACVYQGQAKDGLSGMSDDSETPISSPDEPTYKLANLNVPSSPSSSFKRELMDTNGSF